MNEFLGGYCNVLGGRLGQGFNPAGDGGGFVGEDVGIIFDDGGDKTFIADDGGDKNVIAQQ